MDNGRETGDPTTIQTEARALWLAEAKRLGVHENTLRDFETGCRPDGSLVDQASFAAIATAIEARSLALGQTARVADIVLETAIAGLIGFAHGAGLDEQQRSDGATALRAYLVETKDAAIRALGKDES